MLLLKKQGKAKGCKLRQHIITVLCYLLRLPFGLLNITQRLFNRRARQQPQSILVIKPCCLGDLLMTTPLLEVIRHAYPGASITFVAGTWSKVIPEHYPAVNAVIDCGTVGIPGRYSLNDYMKLVWNLRRRHFDLAFVLDRSPLLALLPWLAGIPRRVGPDSLGRGFSLTDRVPVSSSPDRLQHQAEIYLDLARAIDLPIETPRMHFEPTAQERQSASQPHSQPRHPKSQPCPPERSEGSFAEDRQSLSHPEHHSCHPERQPCPPERSEGSFAEDRQSLSHPQCLRVALFTGGGSNPGMELTAKRWPLERFRELAQKLISGSGAQILLIGGPDDVALNQQLLADLNAPDGSVIDITGKTSIGELAAQLEQCDLFIGNDSSPMHLAAAVNIPVIAIFGPTSPQEYGPYPLDDPKHVSIWRNPTGKPCFFLGKMQTCTHCTCMQAVTVNDVWSAVPRLLGPAVQSRQEESCL